MRVREALKKLGFRTRELPEAEVVGVKVEPGRGVILTLESLSLAENPVPQLRERVVMIFPDREDDDG